MYTFLHFFTDDKFADSAIAEFDCFTNQVSHVYAFVSYDPNYSFKCIKNSSRIIIINPDKLNAFINHKNIKAIVLHNFYSLNYRYLLKINNHVKVIWFAWGYDIYGSGIIKALIKIKKYHKLTNNIVHIKKDIPQILKELPYIVYSNINYRLAVRRVDFFSGILPIEYQLMSKLPYFKAKEVIFTYMKPFSTFQEPIMNNCNQSILIGNSCDPSNNHADIFHILSSIGINNRKIIVPLSYPNSLNKYRDIVINSGKELWKDNFIGLTSFVSIQEYKELISETHYRIFGHERQQAIGNIFLAFKAGCKVFLSKTSVTYPFLKEMGFHIYTIQDDLNASNLSTPLEEEKIIYNYNLIKKIWNWEIVYKNIENLITIVTNS